MKTLAVDFHFTKPVVAFDGDRFYKVEPGVQGLLSLIIEDNLPLSVKTGIGEKVKLYLVAGREVAQERCSRRVKKNDENDAEIIYRLYVVGRARRFDPPSQELLQQKLKVEQYLRLSKAKNRLERLAELLGRKEAIDLFKNVESELRGVKQELERCHGSVARAIIAIFEPQKYTLRHWLRIAGMAGNKSYNRALRQALTGLARSKILKREEPYYSFFKAYMEAKKNQSRNGVAAYKLAWLKLAKKLAVQVWREAKGLPVNLEELYKA